MKNNNNSSKNINLNETHEAQVMRVLREMIAAGEVTTKIINGVEHYGLTPETAATERLVAVTSQKRPGQHAIVQ
jgi:hypothetical protein